MKRRVRKLKNFGASTDSPLEMIDAAIEEAHRSHGTDRDNLALRRAAELGWLAASSAADVAASRLGLGAPRGANGRSRVLEAVERNYGLKSSSLNGKLVAAKAVLHGDCYHENICDRHDVFTVMEEVRGMVDKTLEVTRKIRRRRR